MAKKVIKTNPNLFKLIRTLKIKSNQEDVAIWKDVASKLEGSNRSTAEVNVSSINRYANENEVVLDFTMGSGSTGVACMNTNRKFIGIELEENYFNIAKQRIEEACK